jgi:uncharacterized membrane protein/nitrite reductase/ring-hydroxylating ferredoxin subunit
MRSKAHFKTHPIHPMLVAFPIAFMTGAPAFDAAGLLGDWPRAWTVGAYMSVAAVVTGLIAGVPGFIDYLYVIPPNSSAKKRATQHMVVNLVALAVMAGGWALRDWDSLQPTWMAVALETAALAIVSVGGFLGGTLVFRNQIGVDHRYAHAGKWREQTVEGRPGESVAINDVELKPGQMMLLHANGRRIVLARTEEGFAAFDDHCTHRGASLADGVLACGVVACPWHGSQFNITDGSVKVGPAEKAISTYRVEDSAGQVRLVVPGQS